MIDRHGEGRLQRGGVVQNDGRQVEPLGRLGQDGHAELPSPVGNHKIDDLRRNLFGRADEVAFVLAVLGVHDDDNLARGNGLGGRFNRGKPMGHVQSPFSGGSPWGRQVCLGWPIRCGRRECLPHLSQHAIVAVRRRRANQNHSDGWFWFAIARRIV